MNPETESDSDPYGEVLGLVVFATVTGTFFLDITWGWRALGLATMGAGLYTSVKRRIPYGIEGQPPSGYLKGKVAVVVGVAMMIIGAVIVVMPLVLTR